MKTHAFQRKFTLTFLALFTISMAWADDLELLNSYTLNEYAEKSYLISSLDDWNALAEYVAAGHDCSGLTFKMTSDIGTVTNTMGCQLNSGSGSRKRFAGTFDGDGHTLIVSLTSAASNKNYCAPFAYVKNVTIKNLHITGTVTPSGQFGAGMIGSSGNDNKDGDCTIENCHVSVTIDNHYKTDGSKYPNHGGFIGIAEGRATITNSWFDGAFISNYYENNDLQHCGGFIGLNKISASLTNCLFNPSVLTTDKNNGAGEFVNSTKNAPCILNKAYYTKEFGNNHQGQRIYLERPSEDGYAPVVGIDGNIFYTNKLEVIVKGYGESTGSDHWTFIASPLTDNGIEPTSIPNLIGSQLSSANTLYDYDLYRFNQKAADGKVWENYITHAEGFVLENGKGYLYASKDDVTLTFTGTFNEGTSKEVELTYEGMDYTGWNLVGNPFTIPVYVNRNYYRMNEEGTDIVAVEINKDNTPIAACTGIMVKANRASESIVFSTSAPKETSNQGNVQIAVAQANTRNSAMLDNAIVSFNEGSMLGKFYFGEKIANVYLPQNQQEFAIAASEKQGEMPVCFTTAENGNYTISVVPENVEMSYLHLIDNISGADVDLLAEPSYTFSAKNDDYASRFRLVFSAKQNDSHCDDFAFVSNDNIIINGKGTIQLFDLTGRLVTTKNNVSAISTSGMKPGVYMIRLTDTNIVKTQKIVIK